MGFSATCSRSDPWNAVRQSDAATGSSCLSGALLQTSTLVPPVLALMLASTAAAGPIGGVVVSGDATIVTDGTTTTITQHSSHAVIDWQDFSIGQSDLTQFILPSANAEVLNRVISAIPSEILGRLQSNGKVYLVNPNGIVIGQGAVIDVGGFIGSTLDLDIADFMADGPDHFIGDSRAAVINIGEIRAKDGDIYLVAHRVDNQGSLTATEGEVGLVAARDVVIAPGGSDRVAVRVRIEPDATPDGTGVSNSGIITAAQARLEAANGNAYALAINNTGRIRATGIERQPDGRILLTGRGGRVHAGGSLVARNADGSGGRIVADAGADGAIDVTGTLDAAGAVNTGTRGGRVDVAGDRITVASGARITASGDSGGGTVRVGGLPAGHLATLPTPPGRKPPTPAPDPLAPAGTASAVVIEDGALILASARTDGDGGSVTVWADLTTVFRGSIAARGGDSGGDGGFAEISAAGEVTHAGRVDLRAPHGDTGTLLIDPTDFTIDGGVTGANRWNNVDLGNQLDLANVMVKTAAAGGQAGDITVNAPVSWSAGTALTLDAHNDIIVNQDLTNTGAGGSIQMLAGRDIRVAAGATLTWNAPTGTNIPNPPNVNATWTAGRAVQIDGDIGAVAGGTLRINAGTDITVAASADLRLRHDYDPAGGATKATRYQSLRLTAGGAVTVDGSIRNANNVDIFANGGDVTLNGLMTNGGGNAGVRRLLVNASGDLTVANDIYAYGAVDSSFTAGGDITVTGSVSTSHSQTWTTGAGRAFTLDTAQIRVRHNARTANIVAGTLTIGANGNVRSNGHVSLTADDITLATGPGRRVELDRTNRWLYVRNRTAGSTMCIGSGACGGANELSLTAAEMAELDVNNYTEFGNGNTDLITIDAATDFSRFDARLRSRDIDIAAPVYGGVLRLYSHSGGQMNVGTNVAGQYSVDAAELDLLGQATRIGTLEFRSQNNDILVDSPRTGVNALVPGSNHLSFIAGTGTVIFRNGPVTAVNNLTVDAAMIDIQAGADLKAGADTGLGDAANRTGHVTLRADDGITLAADITSGDNSDILLNADRDRDGVGSLVMTNNAKVTLAPTHGNQINDVTVQVANLSAFKTTGADGFHLNFGGINILPTIGAKVMAIGGNSAADLMCYNAGNVCDLADPTHAGIGVFHVRETEHLDKFFDPGRTRFGSGNTEVLVLANYDYRRLAAGTGNRQLQLIGNEIRFDAEYAGGNPTGAFTGSRAMFANPAFFELGPNVDLQISPASGGRNAAGAAIAPAVDAYYGRSGAAPTYGTTVAGATTGHVISNEFINVWTGRNLRLGTAIDPNNGHLSRYARTTTVDGLDTFTAGRYRNEVHVRGNRVRLTGADTVVNRELRIEAVSGLDDDALIIDAKAISKTRGITVEAWDRLNDGIGSYARGSTITITANGSLVTEHNTSGAADVFLRGRALKIDSGGGLAVDSRGTILFETYDNRRVTNLTLGKAGVSAGANTFLSNDQLARMQSRQGGLTFQGNNFNRNTNNRTRMNLTLDGVDETAFSNIDGRVSGTATAYIASGDGQGRLRFSGAASALGDGDFHFTGQNGVTLDADVSTAPGGALHLDAGYLSVNRQRSRIAGIRGAGTVTATHLRLTALGAGVGTSAQAINTRASNMWLVNAHDEYSNHVGPRSGGLYVDNVSADGLALNQAHNLGGAGETGGSDIRITQTGGGALYVMNDAGDYGADNPWGLATSGVLSRPDRYRINGPTRYPYGQPGDVTLTSDGGLVVLNRIEIDDPATTGTNPGLTGAPVATVDARYDSFTDNVHLINAETGSNLITVDVRPAGGDPAGYTTPTVTLDGGSVLRLDRAIALGAAEYLRVDGGAALTDVTITAPITTAAPAAGTRASLDIRADTDIILGANADLTATAATGLVRLQAAGGSVTMADAHIVGTPVTAPDPGVLPAGTTAVAAGTAVRSKTGSLVTAVAGQEINQGLRLTTGTDLKAGTVLAEGSVIGETMTLRRADGTTVTLAAGTTLTQDLALTADTTLTADTALVAGSIIADGTEFQPTLLAATAGTGAVEVRAGTDIALAQIRTVGGDITVQAGLGGVTGTITDATGAEMADATDDMFHLGGMTDTGHANLHTATGTARLYGKGVGRNSPTGEEFIDFHATGAGGLSIVDPTDATKAGAYGTGAGDGAFVSLLGDFPAAGAVALDVKAEAGVGIAATGDLDWTGASAVKSLGGGDISLIARGLTAAGDLTISGTLDATNAATGVAGTVTLRARRDITSTTGTARVIASKLSAVSETAAVGTAANALLTEVDEIEFSAQTGTYITDIGVDPTLPAGKTVTMRTLPTTVAPATNGAITLRARENIAFDSIDTAAGTVTVEAGWDNTAGALVAGEGSILNGAAGSITTGAGDVLLTAGRNIGSATNFLVADVTGAGTIKARTLGADVAAGDGAYIGFTGDFTLSTSPLEIDSAGSVGIKATENLNWDAAGNIKSAVGANITLIAEGQTKAGDLTVTQTITTTGGNLVLQAANDAVVTAGSTVDAGAAAVTVIAGNAARVDAGSILKAAAVIADAGSGDLRTDTAELTLAAGAGGIRASNTGALLLSGGGKAGSGGGIDVTSGGSLTVGLTQAAAARGATVGHVLADGAGTVALTATTGDIRLDGVVGTAAGGTAGTAHQGLTAAGSGAVTLTAAGGSILDVSAAEVAAGDGITSPGLNVATAGTATFNAISVGFDADGDVGTGVSDGLDISAGTVVATTTGTALGQGVHLTVLGDFTTGQAAGIASARDLTVETVASATAAGDITANSALTASAGGDLLLRAGNDLRVQAGAAVSGGGVVALRAGKAVRMTGGTVQATGTGVAWLQGDTTTEITGGTLTSTGTGAVRTLNVLNKPVAVDAGVVVSGGDVTMTGAAPTTGAAGLAIIGGRDVTLTGAAPATGGGPLVLAVDHTANGAGRLVTDAATSLSAGGAPISIFLVDPTVNDVKAGVGGMPFVEGNPASSGAPVYYFDHSFGTPLPGAAVAPYTVYYEVPAAAGDPMTPPDPEPVIIAPDIVPMPRDEGPSLQTGYLVAFDSDCVNSLTGAQLVARQKPCGGNVARDSRSGAPGLSVAGRPVAGRPVGPGRF